MRRVSKNPRVVARWDRVPFRNAAFDEYCSPTNLSSFAESSSKKSAAKVFKFQVKRALDVILSFLIIAFLAPFLAFVAVLIKTTSRGPVLYKQQRYGYGKQPFNIYKFRTMTVLEPGNDFVQAARLDARVTVIGAVLRRTSLDELPQLFNVLEGTMSLVGPRPHPVSLDDRYCSFIEGYEKRYSVRPGITGLAQVRGFRGPTRHVGDMRDRIRSDQEYVERWSLLTDLRILCLTLGAFFGPNAF